MKLAGRHAVEPTPATTAWRSAWRRVNALRTPCRARTWCFWATMASSFAATCTGQKLVPVDAALAARVAAETNGERLQSELFFECLRRMLK